MSNVTKSSTSDDLLHVNCKGTNLLSVNASRRLFPGVWVLVLYWRPIYFFVVIVESQLCIFVSLSFVLFQVFCSLLWCFLHRRKWCWLQIPLWYAVFNQVCEIALSEVLATQMGVMRRSISQLVWIVQIWSIFASQRVDSAGTRA